MMYWYCDRCQTTVERVPGALPFCPCGGGLEPLLSHGTRVTFSEAWLSQADNAKDSERLGTVVSRRVNNNCARVQWDHLKFPTSYHVKFLEVING